MTKEDLLQHNASLRDSIERVLETHPELREGTEAIALRQDLHVEVGAPFLERTRDKLEERARALIERRPGLAHLFDDLISQKVAFGDESRETKLIAAQEAHKALRVQAERLIAAYIKPESDRPSIIDELISLFDGPPQREANRLAVEALGDGWRDHRS